MSSENLVYMANQIGKFFVSQRTENPVDGIADHLEKFWDPRMRGIIREHAASGGDGLDPPVLKAVLSLS
jgi:formate dehydrogenase subunit delta